MVEIIKNNGKIYTRTSTNRRLIKLKEWGCNQSIFKTTAGSSAEKIWPDKKFFIDTDDHGFIENGNAINASKKIVVLSGSYVECTFMQKTDRLVSVMERKLNGLLREREREENYVCLNAAMSGTHILHAIFVLLAKIIPMSVNIVIYLVDINDFRASSMADGFYYTKHKNLSIFKNDKDAPEKINPDFTQFKKFIRIFYSICKFYGIKCIFVGRTYGNNDKRIITNKHCKNICEKISCDYIDLNQAINAKYCQNTINNIENFLESLTYDKTHLTSSGAKVVGEILAEEVYKLL